MESAKDGSLQSTEEPFICPSDGHFGDPNDCTKFYKCAHGTPVIEYCPATLFWNQGKIKALPEKNLELYRTLLCVIPLKIARQHSSRTQRVRIAFKVSLFGRSLYYRHRGGRKNGRCWWVECTTLIPPGVMGSKSRGVFFELAPFVSFSFLAYYSRTLTCVSVMKKNTILP